MIYQNAYKEHGSYEKAGRALNMGKLAFERRLKAEKEGRVVGRRGLNKVQVAARVAEDADVKQAVLPEFPNPDAPIEKLFALRREQFALTKRRKEAEDWFPIHINDRKPIAILWFGDPHIDDDMCNLELLERHMAYAVTEQGLYAANIGDTTNNWAGRLMHLYAKQDASKKTARRFAEHFLCGAGIPWIVWLMGNHDLWGDGAEILRRMNIHKKLPMLDWEARFEVIFPNKEKVRVHASHKFNGHSMWHPGHGGIKAARFSSDADLFIDGHTHEWGVQQFEMPGKRRCPVVAKARGYKWFDDYATVLGYHSAQNGAAILTIFNPNVTGAGRVMAFADVDAGVAVLRALRAVPLTQPAKKAKRAKAKPAAKRRKGRR